VKFQSRDAGARTFHDAIIVLGPKLYSTKRP
jgi:hypothetical protein